MPRIGYFPRIFSATHLPHRKFDGKWERTNGDYQLATEGEICYGPIFRLLISFITTEAVRNKTRSIYFGNNLSQLLTSLCLKRDGRYIARLKEQLHRLLKMEFIFNYKNNRSQPISISESKELDFPLNIILSEEFYLNIVSRPIPINLDTLNDLKSSGLAIDIYIWLTYRCSYINKPVVINWNTLEIQFGCSFKRHLDFRLNFIKHLKTVLSIYQADVAYNSDNIVICPSNTHISKSSAKNNHNDEKLFMATTYNHR